MEPILNYTDSKGVETPIVGLNNFHLVNALIKVSAQNENVELAKALKEEVFRRMDNRPEEEKAKQA